MNKETVVAKPSRTYLPEDFVIEKWEDISPYFIDLEQRKIEDFGSLWKWMRELSELEAVLEEDLAWRYIRMNLNTRDKEASESFHFFIEHIEPEIAPFKNKFDLKLLKVKFREIDSVEGLNIAIKKAEYHERIFRRENIPLLTRLQAKSQEFGAISAEMTVEFEGKRLTLPKASVYLKDTDRARRENVYRLIQERRLRDKDALNSLFNELLELRNQVALNAGFNNFTEYKFIDLCRFDYDQSDCIEFHTAIEKEVVPLIEQSDLKRKSALGMDKLRPWDTDVDVTGLPPLKPFLDSSDLIEKTIACFSEIDPYFGECIRTMQNMSHLDLDSREGKAPGGFNYPLYEIGVPFIFMNSAGAHRDLVTMVHEGGHAIHSFLSKSLTLTAFKDLPSEIAELASMSMELMSMEHWNIFFPDNSDLLRAKKEQLEQVIQTLPWVAQIDKFQHWIYANPKHVVADREECWQDLMNRFGSSVMNWEHLEEEKKNSWQKQLHLFEVPFYYIEYGMAQLGAIAVWKNYKRDPKSTVEAYRNALSQGYCRSIGEIYSLAGISFNFSQTHVADLMKFVRAELAALG